MDYLSVIKQPVQAELADFIELFNRSLSHEDGMLGSALEHIRRRAGKRMRPMLILLMAKSFGHVTDVTLNAAVGLELLHTASLVHDDVERLYCTCRSPILKRLCAILPNWDERCLTVRYCNCRTSDGATFRKRYIMR